MIGLQYHNSIPTKAALNGPFLRFTGAGTTQPFSTSFCSGNTATFVGVATAFFPTQDPALPDLTNPGTLSYRWYEVGVGALSDSTNITGTATSTLTISNLRTPQDSGRRFFLRADYLASSSSGEIFTGNAVNDPLDSGEVSLTVFPNISIDRQPGIATAAQNVSANISIGGTTTDLRFGNINYIWSANGVILNNGANTVPVETNSSTVTVTESSGYSSPGIYFDLTAFTSGSNVDVTFSTFEESGIFHYINIPNVKNFPENNGTQTFTLTGGRVYGPCSAPNGGLYVGAETPIGGTNNLVVEEGGDDWNDMILSVNRGYFRRLSSAPTVTNISIGATTTVNAITTVSGAGTSSITLSSNTVGIQTISCVVSQSSACNTPIQSNVVNFSTVASRSILNYEEYNDTSTSIIRSGSQNLFDQSLSFGGETENNLRNIILYPSERNINVRITLGAAAGLSNGNNRGGEGGVTTFEYTLLQNVEYVLRLGTTGLNGPGGNNGGGVGAFFYDRGRIIICSGAGGGAGPNGRGGDGGGAGISGENGYGTYGGVGGARITNGTLPTNGVFSGGETYGGPNFVSAVPGRLSACTLGGSSSNISNDYWRSRFTACSDIGVARFRNQSGTEISNSGLILRGFKPGLSHIYNGGNGSSSEGGGGSGTYGGNPGGGSGSGGGGASGYSSGNARIITSILGGNRNTNGYAIIQLA